MGTHQSIIFNNEILLYSKLLSYGGVGVCYQDEWAAEDLLSGGVLMEGSGKKSILIKGEDEDCHQNSAIIWAHNPIKYNMVRGWALRLDDGIWFQHSWIFDTEKNIIIETTMRRKLYYGVTLTNKEAKEVVKYDVDNKMIKQLYRLQ